MAARGVLRGAEVALVPNSPMPGNPRRGAAPSITATAVGTAGAPCPTCPGGRAGPGGAYAFEDARGRGPATAAPAPVARGTAAAGATGGRGGRGGGPRLQLSREPATFSALATAESEVSTRVTNVLARIDWPGKPGAANPVPPLTPAEQARYDAGREVYRNVCQSCHQMDGRGLERVAPTLVGFGARPGAGRRDVAHPAQRQGGQRRSMAPIGATMTDDQIAAVLTYVRREWGQTGDPVDPATVKSVRTETATRTRPWTNDELLAMLGNRAPQ